MTSLLQLLLWPRHLLMALSAISLLVASVPFGLNKIGEVVAGRVLEAVQLAGDRQFVRVQIPLESGSTPIVVTRTGDAKPLAAGDWVFLIGQVAPVDDRHMLVAELALTIADAMRQVRTMAAGWIKNTGALPFILVLLGCAVILAGATMVRLVTATAFAASLAGLTWYAAHVGGKAGWINLPPYGVYPIAILGGLIGLHLGGKVASRFAFAWERTVIATALWAASDQITTQFAWPESVTWIALAVSALLPQAAYATLGALLLGAGLQARNHATLAILGASVCAVLVLHARPHLASVGRTFTLRKEGAAL